MATTTYYAGVVLGVKGRRIELDYPSDAVEMIAEYLDRRYRIYGLEEDTENGEWVETSLSIRHRDYDSQKGYIVFCDYWDSWEVVTVVCEESTIREGWVPWWGEEIFELHLLPLFRENPYLGWSWRDGKPGLAAKVWSKRRLLETYKNFRFNSRAWQRRYNKLLSELVFERLGGR
jgi:hypothetical protein